MATLEEKGMSEAVRSVTISLRRELERRSELQAIRRDLLTMIAEQQKLYEKHNAKLISISQRIYDLTVD